MTADPITLVKLIRDISGSETAPVAQQFGDGIAVTVEGGYASVRKGDPNAEPTPGFFIVPGLDVEPDDHVFYRDTGSYKLILAVLSRNAIVTTSAVAASMATDSLWDAKGDLAAATGADAAVKVTVGANDTVLTADSAEAAGVKWAAPAGGAPSGAAGGDLAGTYPDPTIGAGKVTLAQMANIATDRLIGRDTAATGVPEALTVGGGVEFSGAGGIQRSALTGDVTAAAGSNVTTLAAGSAANLNAGTLPAARMPALTGDVTTSVGAVATAIANDAVTYAKMQNVSATARILARITAAAGDVEEATVAQVMAMNPAPTINVYAASNTWSKPAGARIVRVRVVGCGGGSGGCATTAAGQRAVSAGGGGGGYAEKVFAASALGATETITIGAVGTAGTAGDNDGGAGGTCSFGASGTLVQATGGGGGEGAAATGSPLTVNVGGAGGVGSGGDLNAYGDDGGIGAQPGAAGQSAGANYGGGTVLGGSRRGTVQPEAALAGRVYGGGASGGTIVASTTQIAGAAGALGVVIVETYP